MALDKVELLNDTGVTPGTYNLSSIAVSSDGRITSASSGSTPFIPSTTVANKVVSPSEVLSGTYYCDNFTLSAGVTCYILDSAYIIAKGSVVLDGFVMGSGAETLPYPSPMFKAQFGDNWTSSSLGPDSVYLGNWNGTGIAGGRNAFGGRGGDAITTLRGSGGASGYTWNSTAASLPGHPASGGNPGKTLIVRALGGISVGSTGSLNFMGQSAFQGYTAHFGSPPPADLQLSGAGGGSGGVVILDANGACTNEGTIAAYGGFGCDGINGSTGGGGGGGGIVIIQSRYSSSTLGTIFVQGGAAGISSGLSIGSGGGGGCGGNGGDGSYGTYAGVGTGYSVQTNGEPGIAQTFGTPW